MNVSERGTASRCSGRLPVNVLSVVSASVVSLLLVTGCVGGSGSDDKDGGSSGPKAPDVPKGEKPLASTRLTNFSGDVRFDVRELNRVSNGTTILRFSITNETEESFTQSRILQDGFAGRGDVDANAPSGITLIDTKERKRHYPLRSTDDSCYCTDWDEEDVTTIDPKQRIDSWVAFPSPPKDTTQVTVVPPATNPLPDIKVGKGELKKGEDAPGDLKKPKILDLTNSVDDLDGDSSHQEEGDEVSIMLNSDVLFDTNKSDLTGKAQETLKQTAKEIDDSSTKNVKIDGYTDDTGDDDVNVPLSKDRAESVSKELKKLVTKEGLEFEMSGHGSKDPVASNDTDAGKQKNRRVTVTFKK